MRWSQTGRGCGRRAVDRAWRYPLYVVIEADNKVDTVMTGLAKRHIEADRSAQAGSLQHDSARLGIHDEQVDGRPSHFRREPVHVHVNPDGCESSHSISLMRPTK